ncbi:MAG: hypothetical protein JXA42_14475 [Anaerolineales bacterium]|nr:hypothetical protein [Anaerolineales bacterium]
MKQRTIFPQSVSRIGIVLAIALAGCSQGTLTVSEVWENAQELDGKQIRVRGWAYVYTEPYVGFIGCPPSGVIENDVVVGKMYLLPEEDTSTQSTGIAISKSSLLCEGSHCGISCAPFDPGNMGYCMALRGYSTPTLITYELVGVLEVSQSDSAPRLFLKDIKLSESRRLINGTWESIPAGTIEYVCP